MFSIGKNDTNSMKIELDITGIVNFYTKDILHRLRR